MSKTSEEFYISDSCRRCTCADRQQIPAAKWASFYTENDNSGYPASTPPLPHVTVTSVTSPCEKKKKVCFKKKVQPALNSLKSGQFSEITKSDPPEAAPLLDPTLKGATFFAKIDTILKEVQFFKNLTRRRQHPC